MALRAGGGARSATFETQSVFFRKLSTEVDITKTNAGDIVANRLAQLLGYSDASLSQSGEFTVAGRLPVNLAKGENVEKEFFNLKNVCLNPFEIEADSSMPNIKTTIEAVMLKLNTSWWKYVLNDWREFTESVSSYGNRHPSIQTKIVSVKHEPELASRYLKNKEFDNLKDLDTRLYAAISS